MLEWSDSEVIAGESVEPKPFSGAVDFDGTRPSYSERAWEVAAAGAANRGSVIR